MISSLSGSDLSVLLHVRNSLSLEHRPVSEFFDYELLAISPVSRGLRARRSMWNE